MSGTADFVDFAEGMTAYLVAFTRERLGDKMEFFQNGWNKIAPVDTGLFRHSLRPWAGDEPQDYPSPAPFLPPLGRDAIDAAVHGWLPGMKAGFTDRQPYTGFLLAGGSPQNVNLEGDLTDLCAATAKA
jgi:hypothetical protein